MFLSSVLSRVDCGYSVHKQCKDTANCDCIPQQNKFKKCELILSTVPIPVCSVLLLPVGTVNNVQSVYMSGVCVYIRTYVLYIQQFLHIYIHMYVRIFTYLCTMWCVVFSCALCCCAGDHFPTCYCPVVLLSSHFYIQYFATGIA